MKIVIPGGSGQVGTILSRAFQRDGHEVVVLSRRPAVRPWRVVPWDGQSLGDWSKELAGCDVVVNLAGRSVNCRYSRVNRKAILESRVRSTEIVGQAISRAANPPAVWLQASTATIYSHRYDAAHDEQSGLIGREQAGVPGSWAFSVDVARAWERALNDTVVPHVRKVALRSAIILSPDPGGIFDTLLGLVRHGLGGTAGDGRQYVSWIHEEDFVEVMRWLIAHDLEGVVNVAAPNPVPNAEFMRVLREVARAPVGLPVTRWMLEVGAALMRTETELVLKSRRVAPGRLLEHGFVFKHPIWREAAADLYARWTAARPRGSRTAW